MRLPDFLIAGSQKAGTSWLSLMLSQHPDVYIPRDEIHFFNKAHHFAKGALWYKQQFIGADNACRIGEKTPNYMWVNAPGGETDLPDMHVRIRALLPDVKLIFILRDPVERAISAFNHHVRHGRIAPYWRIDDVLCHDEYEDLRRRFGIISMGMYHTQIAEFLKLYDGSQVLVLIFEEDVRERPQHGLRKVCDFLDIEPNFPFEYPSEAINRQRKSIVSMYCNYFAPPLIRITKRIDRFLPGAPSLYPSDETRNRLADIYRGENEKLFGLLGFEPAAWHR